MKRILLSLLLLFVSQLSFSQDFIEHTISDEIGFIWEIKKIDLDNDSDLDIVTLSDDGSIRIDTFYNQSDGTFTQLNVFQSQFPENNSRIRDIDFLDVNGDSILDIIAGIPLPTQSNPDSSTLQLAYIVNNGNSSFEAPSVINDALIFADRSFSIFDVNQDSFEDIVFVEEFPGVPKKLRYISFLGNENFTDGGVLVENFGDGVFESDFNNDGLEDLISEFAGFEIFTNQDNGNFTRSILPDVSFFTLNTVAGDLNSDGTIDILVVGTGGNMDRNSAWLSNDGNANFTLTEEFPTTSANHAGGIIGDFNNDGMNDFSIGISQNGNGIPYFLNLGNNQFSSIQTIASSNDYVTDQISLDINNDGKLDIVNGTRNGIFWYENNITLGLETNTLASLTLSPNPSNGVYQISGLNHTAVQYKVYDVTGKLVAKDVGNSQISIVDLPSGIYFTEIFEEQKSVVRKLIKI